MPIALDTSETFDVVLETDLEKPEERRPTFTFRYLNIREWRIVVKVGDEREEDKAKSVHEATARATQEVLQAISVNMSGWKNMTDENGQEIHFDPSRLDTMLTVHEAWEIYYQARRQNKLDPESKKNLESPSPTLTDKSADSASESTAETSPQPNSPS